MGKTFNASGENNTFCGIFLVKPTRAKTEQHHEADFLSWDLPAADASADASADDG